MDFEEYSTIPNLTGKLFSYNDMIVSMDCKVPNMRDFTGKYLQSYKEQCEIVKLEEINLPQDHKWLLGQEQKQHGKDFYGCDVADQGRPASRSKKRKDYVPMKIYRKDTLKIITLSSFKIK